MIQSLGLNGCSNLTNATLKTLSIWNKILLKLNIVGINI